MSNQNILAKWRDMVLSISIRIALHNLVKVTTVSALIQLAHSVFQNYFLGRTQFKFSANLRILFEKTAHKLDFWPKNAYSIAISTRYAVNSSRVLYLSVYGKIYIFFKIYVGDFKIKNQNKTGIEKIRRSSNNDCRLQYFWKLTTEIEHWIEISKVHSWLHLIGDLIPFFPQE